MKVLITGFEPFAGMKLNPSQELLQTLKNVQFDFTVETVLLPVSFDQCFQKLKEKIELFKPDYIIGTGLASSRREVTVERVALNVIEARIADNDGNQPHRKEIIVGAPDGLFTQLPIHSMVTSALKDQLPAAISNTAGTYVCNYLMYLIVHYSNLHCLKGGFIHVPPSKEISDQGLEMNVITQTVAKMLRAILDPELSGVNLGTED